MHVLHIGVAVAIAVAPYQLAYQHNEIFNDAPQRIEYIAEHSDYIETVAENWSLEDLRMYLLLLDDDLQSFDELETEYDLVDLFDNRYY